MKHLKKLGSVLLALVMVLALAAPAFAATTGSIKINNAVPGQTYTIYKLFDLAYGGTEDENQNAPHTYSIAADSPWHGFVTGEGEGAAYVTVDAQNYVTWKSDKNGAADIAAFAKLALAYAQENKITGTTETAPAATDGEETSEVNFNGLELGYYLIDSSMGALCILDSANRNATVREKNEKPTIEKEEDDAEEGSNEPGVGDKVPYTVTVHAKPGAQGYVVHDTMSTGLSFNVDSVKVTVGDTTLTAGTDYTVNTTAEDGCTFELTISQSYLNTITNDTDIVVKYTATITADALTVTDPITNKASLKYGDDSETTETEVEHELYDFQLVKTNSDEMGKQVLSGAQFELYDVENGGTPISLILVEDAENGNYYRPAVEGEEGATTTIDAGVATIKGLGAGSYWLKETKQPEGYNLLTELTKVELGEDKIIGDVELSGEGSVWESGGVRIINKTGAELPSTGGIGTTIFYIVGGVLVLGAVVLLITKRRTSVDDE